MGGGQLKSVRSPRSTRGEGRACLTLRTAARTDATGESLALRAEIGFINTHLQEVVSAPLFISAEFLLGSVLVGGGWFLSPEKKGEKNVYSLDYDY